ncbi:HNH endonuclease [Streptomyces sp. NPDC059649]|uniref:HNH endonuclease n=1 Tax=Streptomyces sp. NPDC059649 TaxID=3346895 RepID=UPI003697309C
MAVSKRLRYEILRRDNHACRYCGAAAPSAKLNVDHVIPQTLGGNDAPTNLVTACADCNGGKTSSMPDAQTVADVDQATFRQAGELKEGAERRRVTIFVHLSMVWAWAWEKTGQPISSRDEEFFAEETHKLLECGWSARTDLTEAAFCAGSQNAVDIASYIGRIVRASPAPPSVADERFVTCVDAINAWESAWDLASNQGTPPGALVSRFIDEVGAAFDSGADPEHLVSAAESAGRSLSTDLGKHLTQLLTAGGEN